MAKNIKEKQTQELEAQRRPVEEDFRLLVESVKDYAIVTLDPEGHVTSWNAGAQLMKGYRAEEIIGKHFSCFYTPDDIKNNKPQNELAETAAKGKVEDEAWRVRKDGSRFWANVVITAMRDSNGNLCGFAKVTRDLTERKRAEEKLRLVFESVPVGIAVTDLDGAIIEVNRRMVDILGFSSKNEFLGKKAYEFIASPQRDTAMAKIRESLDHGTTRGTEYSFFKADGSRFPGEFSASILNDASGKPVGFIAIVRDITERKQAEEKVRELRILKEVDRLRSELVANVSHELRTPLASIKGFVTTLLRSDVKWTEEEQRDYLQTVNRETDRLTRLISDLLDVSRIDAGALKLEKGEYYLKQILDSAGDRLTTLVKNHQLNIVMPPDLPKVFADELRIGQVLINLVENATKFSPEGSEIIIGAEPAGDQVIISVIDHGQGIAPELMGKLFDRFYQAQRIADGHKGGTGLGLTICKGIVEAHGGRIWVESKLGEGTTKFSFSLPAAKGGQGG